MTNRRHRAKWTGSLPGESPGDNILNKMSTDRGVKTGERTRRFAFSRVVCTGGLEADENQYKTSLENNNSTI